MSRALRQVGLDRLRAKVAEEFPDPHGGDEGDTEALRSAIVDVLVAGGRAYRRFRYVVDAGEVVALKRCDREADAVRGAGP
jgi:hypothetical protein